MTTFVGLAIHYGLIALYVCGVQFEIQGALNVALFFTAAVLLPMTGMMFTDFGKKSLAQQKHGPLRPVHIAARWCCLAFLVWNGAWFSVLLYALYNILVTAANWLARPSEMPAL